VSCFLTVPATDRTSRHEVHTELRDTRGKLSNLFWMSDYFVLALFRALPWRSRCRAWRSLECGLVLFCMAVLTTPVHAQQANPATLKNLTLEELMNIEVATVNAGSKFDQKVTAAPSYVTRE
jgi:hypothetical protein